MTIQRIDSGSALKLASQPMAESEEQLLSDRETLREIADGLDHLESLVDQTPVITAAANRGYFTPDEDDRVRQALLAYRNYRLAAYEIICHYREYSQVSDEHLRLRCFLIGFAAALILYAKSLKIIRVAEHQPMLRNKLNEPDLKFGLEAGFFDDVLVGYSSLSNYRALAGADRFWRAQRRSRIMRQLDQDGDWSWLCDIIRSKRIVVRNRLLDVLGRRLRFDWRAFWLTVLQPARQTRYSLQTLLGGHIAGVHIVPNPAHVLTPEVLGALRPQLQPGDVLLCRAEGKLTTALLPGFWSHATIYLGSRAELEALNVQTHPHASKHWDEILENSGPLGCVIEAVAPFARICPLEASLKADQVIVLRPNLPRTEIAAALCEAFGHLGKPYDFEFDFNVSSRIVCTELVYRCYHHRGAIRFPLVKRLGRFTLTGDDLVQLTLDEMEKPPTQCNSNLRPIAMILKRRDGQAHEVRPERIVPMLRRIRDGWRPARRAFRQPTLAQPA